MTLFFISHRFHFKTNLESERSYLVSMETLGLINSEGLTLPYNVWKSTRFFLPFNLSASIESYKPAAGETILQEPIIKNSDRTDLFLEFETQTTSVIKILVLYSQARQIAINHERKAFRYID